MVHLTVKKRKLLKCIYMFCDDLNVYYLVIFNEFYHLFTSSNLSLPFIAVRYNRHDFSSVYVRALGCVCVLPDLSGQLPLHLRMDFK